MKLIESRVKSNYVIGGVIVVLATTLALTLWQFVPDSTTGIAIVVLFGILGMAWFYPQTILMISFACAPFQNDISTGLGPFRFSLTEMLLLVTCVITLLRTAGGRLSPKVGPTVIPSLIYLGICLSSSLPNWDSSAATALLQTFTYIIGSVVIFATVLNSPEKFYQACYALVGVCILFSILEFISGSPYILGIHKNGVGGSLAAGIIVCTELWLRAASVKRQTWLACALLIVGCGLIFSLSRGAIVGGVIGLIILLVYRGRIKVLLKTALVLVPAAMILWAYLPAEKKERATDLSMQEHGSLYTRVQVVKYAWQLYLDNPLQGHGVSLRKQLDATNLIVITLAETGFPGLIAFLSIHFSVARMAWRVRQTLPEADPRYSIPALAISLLTCKFCHGLVDHYWSRGSLSIAWATVGVTAAIYIANTKELQLKAREKRFQRTRLEPGS